MAKIGHDACKMQSGQFGSKIKTAKKVRKTIGNQIKVALCKKPLQNTPNIRKKAAFWKWPKLPTMHGLYPMKNSQFGSKIKNAKKVQKKIVRLQ